MAELLCLVKLQNKMLDEQQERSNEQQKQLDQLTQQLRSGATGTFQNRDYQLRTRTRGFQSRQWRDQPSPSLANKTNGENPSYAVGALTCKPLWRQRP